MPEHAIPSEYVVRSLAAEVVLARLQRRSPWFALEELFRCPELAAPVADELDRLVEPIQ